MKRACCALAFSLILGAGCSSLLMSTTSPPTYYQIEYTPSGGMCSKTFGEAVKVWDFSTATPYDRDDMVVLEGERQVLYSSGQQWVARPGTMIAQSLIRDLDFDPLFLQAIGPNSPVVAPLELSGRVLVFAWEKTGVEYRAVFQVEVSLMESRGPGEILFSRDYRFESDTTKNNTPSAFARAMSVLANDFSKNLRRDLCSKVTESPKK